MEVYDSSQGFERSESVAIPLEQEEDRTNSPTPHIPTSFLCPSNLGAFLESTTVSFVGGGWKETSGIKEVTTSVNTELQEDREPEIELQKDEIELPKNREPEIEQCSNKSKESHCTYGK